MGFVGWEPAEGCTEGPEPGAVALMHWVLGMYDRIGVYSLGVYNCRMIRGCAFPSVHGEGRALDIGLRVPTAGALPTAIDWSSGSAG